MASQVRWIKKQLDGARATGKAAFVVGVAAGHDRSEVSGTAGPLAAEFLLSFAQSLHLGRSPAAAFAEAMGDLTPEARALAEGDMG